jgi:hypothetical protein
MKLPISHRGSVPRITPLDGVPPLPKRKEDGKPRNNKPYVKRPSRAKR